MINDRPKARTDDVIAERVDDELVIYDQQTQTGHCLSAAAAQVWEHCDGIDTQAEIARELGLDPAIVERAVAELAQASLLATETVAEREYSRRDAAKRLAKFGAAALTVPMVFSVAVPSALAAASVCAARQGCSGTALTRGGSETAANEFCVSHYAHCTACACTGMFNGLGYTCSGDCT